MTVIVETGSGVRNANSYVTSAWVTTYLTDRGREAENSWSTSAEKDQAVVKATDHIEKHWGPRFLGRREFSFAGVNSEGSILFVTNVANGNTVTVGQITYTFKESLTTLIETPNEVRIGSNGAASVENISLAINGDTSQIGVLFSNGTEQNPAATANANLALLELTATADGASGDFTPLAATLANGQLTAFAGGLDGGQQPLSFPRIYLYDSLGLAVQGVPWKVRAATAEYAVRALAGALAPDPTVGEYGASLRSTRTKIGPLEEEFVFNEGSHLSALPIPYPAADDLLAEYVRPEGVVYR